MQLWDWGEGSSVPPPAPRSLKVKTTFEVDEADVNVETPIQFNSLFSTACDWVGHTHRHIFFHVSNRYVVWYGRTVNKWNYMKGAVQLQIIGAQLSNWTPLGSVCACMHVLFSKIKCVIITSHRWTSDTITQAKRTWKITEALPDITFPSCRYVLLP